MRLAVLIIGLVLMVVVAAQSCAALIAGGLADRRDVSEGGGFGVLVAFLFLLGAAFAWGVPTVSMICFALAMIYGLVGGVSTPFKDLTVWGVAAGTLAILSFFGRRRARTIKTGAVDRGSGGPTERAGCCSECGTQDAALATYCLSCGMRLDAAGNDSFETARVHKRGGGSWGKRLFFVAVVLGVALLVLPPVAGFIVGVTTAISRPRGDPQPPTRIVMPAQ